MNTILRELNIYVCKCGVLLQLNKLKDDQFDHSLRSEKYICPVCRRKIEMEK